MVAEVSLRQGLENMVMWDDSAVIDRHKELVERLLDRYSADESVLGVILVGSVGKGYQDENSDIDLEVVVTEERFRLFEEKNEELIHTEKYDLMFTTMENLERVTECERDEDHWRYQDCPVLLDKTSKLEDILEEAAKYDVDSRLKRLKRYYLRYWQNTLHSLGCLRHKNNWGARIYAALAMRDLIRLLFNLNHRWAPKLQWAFKEIHLLDRKPPNLESGIESVLAKPDSARFSKLWEETAKLLREEQYTWIDNPEEIL